MSLQDIRDLQNQFQQSAADTQQLQKALQNAGLTGKEMAQVDEVVKALKALGTDKPYQDPNTLTQLTSQALAKAQTLEQDLRKKLDTSNQQLFLNGVGEVPPQFKSAVDDYFKALAKKKGGGK